MESTAGQLPRLRLTMGVLTADAAGTSRGKRMNQGRAQGRPPRRSRQLTAVLSVAALTLAACGAEEAEPDAPDDAADTEDIDDEEPDDESDDGDDDERGDGDPEASTLTVDGEDIELYFTECLEQFEHEAVEISARGYDPLNPDHDPELQLHLSVDEDPQDEGFTRPPHLRRAPVEVEDEFDGHRWEPVEGSEPIEINWDGTSGEREFEIIEVGDDEPDGEEGDVMEVTFDLVC